MIRYQPVFQPQARKEYLDGVAWYETRKAGLGLDFAREVGEAVARIAENPLLHPVGNGQYREAPVHRYPYLIVYKVKPALKQVHVLAVFHTSRDPKKKRGR